MTAQSKATIKSYFETGDTPTEAQFTDLIDSYLDVGDVGTAAAANVGDFAAASHAHAAADITSGTIAAARLGSGTADGTTYLRGDGTWNTPAGGGGMSSLVEDTSPQLGGDLDLNGHVITGFEIGTDVQAYDADTLKADTADQLTAGFSSSDYAAGTKTSGTYTPDPADGNFQVATNGGAHTLAPPTNSCTIVIHYTNNGSAGAIITSGFTLVDGDAFTTTDTHEFVCVIVKINDVSTLTVKALQ